MFTMYILIFITLTILGTILDILWFKYRYHIQPNRILPYALIANSVGWGIVAILGGFWPLYWIILVARLFIYGIPLSKKNFGEDFRKSTLMTPLLLQFVLLYFLLMIFDR